MTTDHLAGLRVRGATMADAELLRAWRNDVVTRSMSLQTGEVGLEDHLTWLARSLSASDRVILVAEDTATGVAVGMCRFDLDDSRSAEVSVNVAPDQRGRGMGRALVEAGIAAFTADRPDVVVLTAVIRAENAASIRLFEALGFRRADDSDGLRRYVRDSGRAEERP